MMGLMIKTNETANRLILAAVLALAPVIDAQDMRRIALDTEAGTIFVRMLVGERNFPDTPLEIAEITFPPGTLAPPHRHATNEIFHVLEGHLGHGVGSDIVWLGPGQVGVVRAGELIAHSTRAARPVRALVVWAPSGGAAELVERFGFEQRSEAHGRIAEGAKMTEHKKKLVGILVFDGFLTSEVTAAIEVLGSATKSCLSSHSAVTVAVDHARVTSEEGLTLGADYTLGDVPPLDVVIVPSAAVMEPLLSNEGLVDFLRTRAPSASHLASHCSGAFLLGRAGLLDGRRATTYPGGEEELSRLHPDAEVETGVKVVDDGALVTSQGATVTYEASLVLLVITEREIESSRAYRSRQLLSSASLANASADSTQERADGSLSVIAARGRVCPTNRTSPAVARCSGLLSSNHQRMMAR